MLENNIESLHKEILYIAEFFHDFCNRHSLDYFLLGGTALGAVRHGGFIPWDDDFDVCMPQNHYYRFLELFEENDEFILEYENTDNFGFFFTKVKLKNTFYKENDHQSHLENNFIFIDVMCLSNSRGFIQKYFQYIIAKILSAKAVSRRGWYKNKHKLYFSKLISLFFPNYLNKFFLNYVRFDNKNSDYIHFFGRAPLTKAIIPKDLVYPQKLVNFESTSFYCFNNICTYLKLRFGDDCFNIPSQETIDSFGNHCVEYKSRVDI